MAIEDPGGKRVTGGMEEPDTAAPERAPGRILGGVFLLSLCAVAFEVSLVRTFAFVFRYHYLFLIVSFAICGYGLGALVHYLCFRRPDASGGRAVRLTALFALSLPITLALILWVGVRSVASLPLLEGVRNVASLPLPPLLLPVIPFFLAGMSLAELFARYGPQAARLYGYDLAGAAVASLATLGLLSGLGAINTPLLLGMLGGVSALLLAGVGWGNGRPGVSGPARLLDRVAAGGAIAVAAVLLASNLLVRWLDVPPLPPNANPLLTKPLLRELGAPDTPSRIVETRWSAVARIDLVEERGAPDLKYVYTDGDTPTHLLRFNGDLNSVSYLAGSIAFLPFEVARPDRVLAIGPGGGQDVLMARLAGAKQVEGVEISGPTIDLVHDYRAFSGDPYHMPGVTAHVMDGRSYVTRSRDSFDLIYSALTLTASAGRAGMAHTESYIHTVEAVREYWRHLTPRGVYGLVLQEEPLAMRAFFTALEVVRRETGKPVTEAMRHLALVQVPDEQLGGGPYRRLLLLKKSAWTPAEGGRLMRAVGLRGLHAVFVPSGLESLVPFRDLRSGATTPEREVAEYRIGGQFLDIAPVHDDRPFFVYLMHGLPPEFPTMLRWLAVATGFFTLVPVVLRSRRRASTGPGSGRVPVSVELRHFPYAALFALLGAGFMLLEIPLIQQFILFLGHPTLSLAVILFSLLLGTAAGSGWSQRWPVERLAARGAVAAVFVAGFSMAIFYAVPLLQRTLAGMPLAVRAIAAGLPVWLLGVGLGIPFPSGLRKVRLFDPTFIPWAWGINGLMSVFGSVLAMALALTSGFHAVFSAGAVSYVAVALLLPLLPRVPEPAANDDRPPTTDDRPPTSLTGYTG